MSSREEFYFKFSRNKWNSSDLKTKLWRRIFRSARFLITTLKSFIRTRRLCTGLANSRHNIWSDRFISRLLHSGSTLLDQQISLIVSLHSTSDLQSCDDISTASCSSRGLKHTSISFTFAWSRSPTKWEISRLMQNLKCARMIAGFSAITWSSTLNSGSLSKSWPVMAMVRRLRLSRTNVNSSRV